MKKTFLRGLFVSLGIIVGVGFSSIVNIDKASAYSINTEYKLRANEGSPFTAEKRYIILHETANPTSTGRNEASYMSRNWGSAYTQYIVGDGIVYQVGEPGYMSYGAGNGNIYSPVQIELQHTSNKSLFNKNYKVYIDLARDSAKKYNIPLTFEPSFGKKGIVSHKYISDNIWGDHQDPFSYLASMGISKSQLAKDLKNGVGSSSNGSNSSNNYNPDKPTTPNKPTYPNLNVVTWNKWEITDTDLIVRKSPTTNSSVIRTLAKNTKIEVNQLVKNGQKVNSYSSWFRLKSGGYVSGAYVTQTNAPVVVQPTPPNSSNFVSQHGTFTANTSIIVRKNSASTSATISGTLHYGESINYDGYKINGGYVWIHYTSYNGSNLWLPIRNVGGTLWGSIY